MASYYLHACIVLVACVSVVQSGAILSTKLVQYSNSEGKDWNNKCCDIGLFGNCALSKCDHRFIFCFDRQNGGSSFTTCAYEQKSTGEYQQDKNVNNFGSILTNGIVNPIVLRFEEWPGSFKLKVEIDDDDSGHSGHDLVDKIYYVYSATPARAEVEAQTVTRVIPGSRTQTTVTSLEAQFRLWCETDYYGSACAVHCVSKDDATGHYTCDPNSGSIICLPGWEDVSTDCTIVKDNCVGHQCLNGARCIDAYDSYTCACASGFVGTYCETDVDECASDPCLNGGTCTDKANGFHCTCPAAFLGEDCGHHLCEQHNPCLNGGTCYDVGLCSCPDGFLGPTCAINMCENTLCENGGFCDNGTCLCEEGYVGRFCSVAICDYIRCFGGGTCSKGKCTCSAGYTGFFCENNVNECESDPCLHAGTCIDGANGFTCRCLPSYNGTLCEHDLTSLITTVPPTNINDVGFDKVYDYPDSDVVVCATTDGEDQSQLIIILIVAFFVLLLVIIISVSLLIRYRRRMKMMENGSASGSVHFTNEDASASFANPLYDQSRSPRPPEAMVTLDPSGLNRSTSTEAVENAANTQSQTDERKPPVDVYSQTKTGIHGSGAHGQTGDEEEDPYAMIAPGAEYAVPANRGPRPNLPPRYSSVDESAVYDTPKEPEFDESAYATALETKAVGLYESPPAARPTGSPPNYEASLYDSPAPTSVHAMAALYDSPPVGRYPRNRSDEAGALPPKVPLDNK